LLTDLSILVRTSKHNKDYLAQIGIGANRYIAENDPKNVESMQDCVNCAKALSNHAETFLAHLNSSHVNDAIKRLRYWSEHPPFDWSELNVRSRALRDTIEVELREYYFYQYPKQKAAKLMAWTDDWKAACAAFPDIKIDVYCATDCYALGHDTASVFHSMRVAEYGLRAIAKERQLAVNKNKPIEWATWQEVIGSKSVGPNKDAALEFYSGARADLNGFKDEYRNQVSHLRSTYDEFQSIRALTNVQHFMNRISAKIDHTHQQINWGL
jgi:hypothetical protein